MIQDFSLNVAFIILNVYRHVYNIHLEGTMSHNFEIGLSFIFVKKREDFYYFFIIIFLYFIKLNLGPILKF